MRLHIRNAGEEHEEEPEKVVTRKTFERVVGAQKHHYEVLRHEKNMLEEAYSHKLNEQEIKYLKLVKSQKVVLFVTGVSCLLAGGGLGWLIH